MRTKEKLDVPTENITLILAEYQALRDINIKRIEIRHQLTSLALIAPGTVLAVGFQAKNAFLMLAYPILACFLSAVWLANEQRLHVLASYLRKLESKVGENNIGWDHYYIRFHKPFRLIGITGTAAIFIFTELLTLLAGITIANFNVAQTILFACSILSIVITIILVVILEVQRLALLKIR